MVLQEGLPRLVRRAPNRAQDARDSAFGYTDTQHFQFAMNPGCAPQRISGSQTLKQSAQFCGGTGTTAPPSLRLREPGPELAERSRCQRTTVSGWTYSKE